MEIIMVLPLLIRMSLDDCHAEMETSKTEDQEVYKQTSIIKKIMWLPYICLNMTNWKSANSKMFRYSSKFINTLLFLHIWDHFVDIVKVKVIAT